jgi:hypothetical protein
MTHSTDSFNLDVRIRERLLKKRVITSTSVESHLAGLKDAESEMVTLEIEQPALAKPPVAAPPVVQPVQPIRTSMADLPPPPPGLIKESPTPPYTPMVIENVPKESSVNGVSLTSSDDDADELAAGAEDDMDADDGDADDAANGAAEHAADEAGEEAAAGEPKADGIDDEWGG